MLTNIYITLLKSDEKYYLLSEQDGGVIGFETEQKAVDFWEKGYESARSRGVCGSTGAMVDFVCNQPSVIYFAHQLEMEDVLFDKPPFTMMWLGNYHGIECQKNGAEYWGKGVKPQLIKMEVVPR